MYTIRLCPKLTNRFQQFGRGDFVLQAPWWAPRRGFSELDIPRHTGEQIEIDLRLDPRQQGCYKFGRFILLDSLFEVSFDSAVGEQFGAFCVPSNKQPPDDSRKMLCSTKRAKILSTLVAIKHLRTFPYQ